MRLCSFLRSRQGILVVKLVTLCIGKFLGRHTGRCTSGSQSTTTEIYILVLEGVSGSENLTTITCKPTPTPTPTPSPSTHRLTVPTPLLRHSLPAFFVEAKLFHAIGLALLAESWHHVHRLIIVIIIITVCFSEEGGESGQSICAAGHRSLRGSS